MIHQQIKDLFFSSVEHVVSDISQYAVHPDSDFQRSRKIPAQKLISFLVSQGSSSTRVEMLDFCGLDSSMPTASAFSQQRAKLKPEALEAVFRHFNSSVMELPSASFKDSHYRFLAADGSTCAFFSTLAFSSADYYCCPGYSANGVYSMHLNAFYDLDTHTYTDALIQPVRCKNEFSAFCDIVDRRDVVGGRKNVYIGDRGYCSYNNMAHVVEQEIWARLIAYNITETMINHTVVEKQRIKHEYKVNFTMAAHICRVFLRLTTEKDQYDVMSLLKKELIPIRNERQYPRFQTAHFRRPRYFIYRAA